MRLTSSFIGKGLMGIVLSAAYALPMSGSASAADMPAYGAPQGGYAPADAPLEFGTGWYLRGDAAFGPEDKPKLLLRDSNPTFSRQGTSNGYAFGGGAGYKFNDYLRADITADYLDTFTYSGVATCGGACANVERTTLWRWDGLVNGYLDLGTWAGLTPYVGLGAGFSAIHQDGSVSYAGGLVPGAPVPARTAYQFAWAAMGGLSYAVSPHMLIDLGYRYLDLGHATMTIAPTSTVTRSITEQQVRLGLRYMID